MSLDHIRDRAIATVQTEEVHDNNEHSKSEEADMQADLDRPDQQMEVSHIQARLPE